jgi:hypothetical protein
MDHLSLSDELIAGKMFTKLDISAANEFFMRGVGMLSVDISLETSLLRFEG